ncbi:hypothetical protein AAEO56_17225 [Flavobacterium sp. DGU11]|uniref:O-Antigen ligase n=1 Tax=Flavobacterium arundinis TaxID=3139143 RepID=A0ABU9I0Q9_9FLAO
MKVIVPANIFYQALFVLCIAMPYFDNYEITFMVWSFTAAATICRKYSMEIIKQLACFAGILLIAFFAMFFGKYQMYNIIRDFTYLIKPVLGLLIGYQICKRSYTGIFRLIVITGAIIASLHYIKLAIAVLVLHAHTVNDIRQHAGYFSDFEVFALILLLFYKRFDLGFSKKQVYVLVAFIGFSVFMYMARTNFIQVVVLSMAMKNYFKINRRSVILLSSTIMLVVIGYSAILYYNPKRNGDGLEALLYKIKLAPLEPFRTHVDLTDWKEFNDNYRSYENIMTMKQVPAEGVPAVLFGKGMGSTIDLKVKMWLGDQEMRYISILHNGFMTVFLKSGLLGIVLFIISLRLNFKKRRSVLPRVRELNLLMLGTGIFMIISAWVFMGLYFLADTKSILIGMFICAREAYIKQQASGHLQE